MKTKNSKNILSIVVFSSFILMAIASATLEQTTEGNYSNNESSSNSSSSDCTLNYWVEKSGEYYKPYFQKKCNRGLSLDYALYYKETDELFYEGHLYFTSNSESPSTGMYAKAPIRIVIKSKRWE